MSYICYLSQEPASLKTCVESLALGHLRGTFCLTLLSIWQLHGENDFSLKVKVTGLFFKGIFKVWLTCPVEPRIK